MGARRNLTISLDEITIKKAKVFAAMQDTSISGLVADLIANFVKQREEYDQAQRHALAFMERGLHLGGSGLSVSRDELHER